MNDLSLNTKALLLLTGDLVAGRAAEAVSPLSATQRVAFIRTLMQLKAEPALLLNSDEKVVNDLISRCEASGAIPQGMIRALLGRQFLLDLAIEYWKTRNLWIVGLWDDEYPERLRNRLGAQAPAILYGAGNPALLNDVSAQRLAVIGSRQAPGEAVEYAARTGRLAAASGITLVSAGAKGIDLTAMEATMTAGGTVLAVLSDTLAKTAIARGYRESVETGRFTIVSACDPNCTYSADRATTRNRVLYALTDAALIVQSEISRGGTWAGAIQQLEHDRCVPVYVRRDAPNPTALNALYGKGAYLWTDPTDSAMLRMVMSRLPGPVRVSAVEATVAASAGITNDLFSHESHAAAPAVTFGADMMPVLPTSLMRHAPRFDGAANPAAIPAAPVPSRQAPRTPHTHAAASAAKDEGKEEPQPSHSAHHSAHAAAKRVPAPAETVKPEVAASAVPEVKAEVNPEVKAEAKPEVAEVKAEVKTEIKTEVKVEAKNEPASSGTEFSLSGEAPKKPERTKSVVPVRIPDKRRQEFCGRFESFTLDLLIELLETPMSEADVAETLNLTKAQARAWLHRLLEDGAVTRVKGSTAASRACFYSSTQTSMKV